MAVLHRFYCTFLTFGLILLYYDKTFQGLCLVSAQQKLDDLFKYVENPNSENLDKRMVLEIIP